MSCVLVAFGLTALSAKAQAFAPAAGGLSEAGASPVSRKAETADLTDLTYRSVSIRGTRLVKSVTLSFAAELVDHDGDVATSPRWIYTMTADAGCNILSGRYLLKNGRLVWSRSIVGSDIGCPIQGDQWLMRTLQRGVSARIVNSQLVLAGERGTKIVLAVSP